MARGPGKYSQAAAALKNLLKAQGVIVIVYDGSNGDGIGAVLPSELLPHIPGDLRALAAQIEADLQAPHYP